MPRQSTWPPKITNHKGSARVRWKGKDYYLGPFTGPELRQRYTALIAELARVDALPQHPAPACPELTIDELCELYLTQQEKLRAGKQELKNIRAAVEVLRRTFPFLPASQFELRHLRRLQEVMASGSWLTPEERAEREKPKKKGSKPRPVGWCRNVVNAQIVKVRSLFRWAEEESHCPKGTWGHLRCLKPLPPDTPLARHTEPPGPSELDDVMKVTSHCPDQVAAMLLLQWWTGMRSGEVVILRPMDLDRSEEIWTYRPGSDLPFGRHKNAHRRQHRIVPIGPEAQKVLLPWLAGKEPGEYVFPPTGPKATRAKHQHYDSRVYSRAVRRASGRAGVHLTPYQGRHATAKRVKATLSKEAAAAALGQKKVDMADHYGGFDIDLAKEAAKRAG